MIDGVVLVFLIFCAKYSSQTSHFNDNLVIRQLVTQWAPLIWMSPGEKYHPSSVNDYFQNMQLAEENGKLFHVSLNEANFTNLNTKPLYLIARGSLLDCVQNKKTCFLNGFNPKLRPSSTYVLIARCSPNSSFRSSNINGLRNDISILYGKSEPKLYFTASYWNFYPYNEGKKICFIGRVPVLPIFGRCFGHRKTIGSHVGDWEHMTLSFKGQPYPAELYLAIHDTGGSYKYDVQSRIFKLSPKNNAKKRVQKPKLPPIVRLQTGHPVLFAANGSHGLWSAPGEHEWVKIPRLTDYCGYGTPWKTWENLQIFYLASGDLPQWMYFKGKWGNPKSNCIFSKKLGLCEFTDGPPGPLRNKQDVTCYSKHVV